MMVMVRALLGESNGGEIVQESIGKVIRHIALDNDALLITFADDTRIRAFDAGQSCCESRYMVVDDDLTQFEGATLLGIEVRDAPNIEDDSSEHEVQFLEVQTSLGAISVANHNEHNGYYGGFWLRVVRA